MSEVLQEVREQSEGMSARELVALAVERFGDRLALASSMGVEDQVLTDMLSKVCPQPRVFTLDTGRLPQVTYETIAATDRRYGIRVKLLFPDREKVEEMMDAHGPNLFRQSVELRKLCCHVRKVIPLTRELAGLDAWMTGLRREQSQTRTAVQRVQWDEANGLIRISPIADWTTEQVWQYIRDNDVPYNPLHDQCYPSVGCEPCTRAVKEGEDIRAGRWWWEQPEHKECGLHVVDGKLVRDGR